MRTTTKKKILLVDDESGFGQLMKSMLEAQGYQVSIAYDGQEASDLLFKDIPDLVICDIVMPKKSGLELFKETRTKESTSTVPFLFISGYKDEEMLSMARKVGVYTILNKPVDLDHVFSRVKTLLKER
jgi:DNA-binding response OmpR family regulator